MIRKSLLTILIFGCDTSAKRSLCGNITEGFKFTLRHNRSGASCAQPGEVWQYLNLGATPRHISQRFPILS